MSSPKKNVAYEFDIALVDSATGDFKAAPTIAAGDFKVSTDNAAFGNLATLPVVDPAGSIVVKINLSASEMNGDKIMVQCIDAAGAEWDDVLIFIDATVANVDDIVRSTTPANTLDVSAGGEAGIDWANIGSPTTAQDLSSTDFQLCDTVTTLTGHTAQTADHTTAIADIPTVSEFNARTILSASYFDPVADTVVNVTNVATLTGHTNQTGDSFARIGAAGVSLTDLGGMSTGMKAEVLVEVNAALDTAISELAQAQPTATPSVRTGIMLMYMALRNKLDVQTSGVDELEIHNAAGTLIIKKLLTDDGSDYSEAVMISGP